uniref:Uncharacterized protein n=1 Tax=Parascaris equorum TaxID=6256 RepID=A0A914RN11_PAREQ
LFLKNSKISEGGQCSDTCKHTFLLNSRAKKPLLPFETAPDPSPIQFAGGSDRRSATSVPLISMTFNSWKHSVSIICKQTSTKY